jgi:hypothetical protein
VRLERSRGEAEAGGLAPVLVWESFNGAIDSLSLCGSGGGRYSRLLQSRLERTFRSGAPWGRDERLVIDLTWHRLSATIVRPESTQTRHYGLSVPRR